MRCLGHQISNDGNRSVGWEKVKESVWYAWRGNVRKGVFHGPPTAKSRLLNKAALGTFLFHSTLLNWSEIFQNRVQQFQIFLLSRCLDFEPRQGEEPQRSWQRRTLVAGNVLKKGGYWHVAWQKNLANWLAHLDRHPECWVRKLLATRDESFLQAQREMFAANGGSRRWNSMAGRTGTRVGAGYIATRTEAACRDWTRCFDSSQCSFLQTNNRGGNRSQPISR